jgi:hypothetical protein
MYRVALVTMVLLLIAGTTSASQLVARYNFEEGSGTTALDTSGNSYDGTIVGATYVAGVSGAFALDFNPPGTGTDQVALPTGAWDNHITSNEQSATVALWYKSTFDFGENQNSNYTWDIAWCTNGSYGWDQSLPIHGNEAVADLNVGNRIQWTMGTLPEFDRNAWHHFVMTVYGGIDTVAMWIDGNLVAVGHNKTAAFSGTTNYHTIGNTYHNALPWHGYIDDVMIFDGAVASSDIGELMQGNPVPEPATIALLSLGGLALIRKRR